MPLYNVNVLVVLNLKGIVCHFGKYSYSISRQQIDEENDITNMTGQALLSLA